MRTVAIAGAAIVAGALFAQAAPVPISHIQARSSTNTLAGLDLYQGDVNQLITRNRVIEEGLESGAELASRSGKVGEASTSEIEEVTSALSSPHVSLSNAHDEKLSSLHEPVRVGVQNNLDKALEKAAQEYDKVAKTYDRKADSLYRLEHDLKHTQDRIAALDALASAPAKRKPKRSWIVSLFKKKKPVAEDPHIHDKLQDLQLLEQYLKSKYPAQAEAHDKAVKAIKEVHEPWKKAWLNKYHKGSVKSPTFYQPMYRTGFNIKERYSTALNTFVPAA